MSSFLDRCSADYEAERWSANFNFVDWLAVSGRPRYRGFVPFYSSKAAVVGLTESLALELAPEILVNAIAPGPILEPPGLTPEENMEVIEATPLRRWGGAAEIAKTVLFLVDSDFITGECLRVDGGRHLY
jgi:NAD(P)-dependent dehydrogenase (short-subunit alcohol dehydrogenase family)